MIVVSKDALADLDRLRAFLEANDPNAARRVGRMLVDAIDSLARFPDRGRSLPDGDLRELVVPFGSSAYVVRYVHSAELDRVVIVRVWHGRESRE